jgi:hypothetical protein
VLHRVSSLRGNGAAVLSNKDCCEGSCVHQGLSGSGLRRGDLHHVACWIRSSSSGCVHRHDWKISIRVDSLWKIGTKHQGSPVWSLSRVGALVARTRPRRPRGTCERRPRVQIGFGGALALVHIKRMSTGWWSIAATTLYIRCFCCFVLFLSHALLC